MAATISMRIVHRLWNISLSKPNLTMTRNQALRALILEFEMSVQRKSFFAERQTKTDGKTHRHPNSNSSLDTVFVSKKDFEHEPL